MPLLEQSIDLLAAAVDKNKNGKWYTNAAGVLAYAAPGEDYTHHVYRAGVWEPVGYLFESAFQNLLKYSEDQSNAVWVGPNLTPALNVTAAPTGELTADSLTRSTTAASNYRQQNLTTEVTGSGFRVTGWGFFKKKATGNRVGLRLVGTYPSRADAVFDLATGTLIGVSTGGSYNVASVEAQIIKLANDWYACVLSAVTDSTGCRSFIFGPTAAGTIGGWEGAQATLSDLYVWGTCAGVGAFGSYVPTTNAAASRPADSVTVGDTSWLEAAKGKFRLELAYTPNTAISPSTRNFFDCRDGVNNGWRCGVTANASTIFLGVNSAGVSASGAQAWTPGSTYQIAFNCEGVTWGATVDGNQKIAPTALGALDTIGATAYIGRGSSTGQADGAFLSVKLYYYVEVDEPTFEQRLRQPGKQTAVLVEVTVGQRLSYFEASGAGWLTPRDGTVTALHYAGELVPKAADQAAADALERGWAIVGETIYLKLDAGEVPWGGFVRASRTFYLATVEKILGGRYYEPRVLSVPSLSRRIERRFGGLPQIGGGVLKLANLDGFFDDLDLDWHSGETVMRLGVDLPGAPMDLADYQPIGRWLNGGLSGRDDASCELTLEDPRARLQEKLPRELYTREAYPFIRDQEVGRPIPLAYGQIHSAAPACIHTEDKRFKLAGHAIHAIDAIKVWNQDGSRWEYVEATGVDLAAAEFELPMWDGSAAVAVDFQGMETDGGELMTSPADQIRDLCLRVGEPVNEASFAAAAARLELARFDTWQYAAEQRSALDLVSELLEAAQAYLTEDFDGELALEVFRPQAGEALAHYGDDDLREDPRVTEDTRDITSLVAAQYADRTVEKWSELVTHERPSTQHRAAASSALQSTRPVKLARKLDAEYWTQRITRASARPLVTMTVVTHLHGLLSPAGDQVRITWQRWGLDELFEVLEQRVDLGADRVTFVLGDRHGWKSQAGLWVDDAATLPARFAGLAGYGAGALRWQKNWAPAIKAWARQNCGYWMSERALVLDDDPQSHDVSQWV